MRPPAALRAVARGLAVCIVTTAAACAGAPTSPPAWQTAIASSSHRPVADTPATSTRLAHGAQPDLFVRCADPQRCPEAVGMVVFPGDDEPERCTGTLIGPGEVITASHCVSPAERRDGASCRGAWIAFPARNDDAGEWVECAEVTRVAGAIAEDALHTEYAVLRLTRATRRAPLELRATPIEIGSVVTVVSVTPHPIYGTTHALSERLCRVMDSEPAVAELGPRAAGVGWLSDCPIHAGNSGSPVLDAEGRVRAIVHGGTWTGLGIGVTSGLGEPARD